MSTEQQYIAPLSDLIDASQIPGDFQALESLAQEGVDILLQKIFYKSYVANTPGSDVSYYHLIVVTKALRLPILDIGFNIVFFKSPNNDSSEFPITFDVRWPIKKYISNFKTQGFSYAPQALVDIFLELTNVDEQTFYRNIVTSFFNGGDDSYLTFFSSLENNISAYSEGIIAVDAEITNILTQLDTIKNEVKDLLTTTNLFTVENIFDNYTEDSDIDNSVQSIVASLEKLNDDFDIELNIFKEVVVSAIANFSINEAFDRLADLFGSWLEDITIQQIKDLLIPQFSLKLSNINMGLEFPRKWLVPVYTGSEPVSGLNINDPLPEPFQSSLDFTVGDLIYSTQDSFLFENQAHFTFKRSMIGNTGLLVEFEGLKVDMSDSYNIPEAIADGRPDNFQGIYAEKAAITLPSKWFKNVDNTTLQIAGYNMLIGTGGFSGRIALEAVSGTQGANDYLWANLGDNGFRVGFNSFDITFKQNAIVESNIRAKLEIPRFNKDNSDSESLTVDVIGHLSENGDFNLTAALNPPLQANLFNFVNFDFKSFEIGRQGSDFYLGTSCDIWFDNEISSSLIFLRKPIFTKLDFYKNYSILAA
ncbi:hypothetical protein LJC68_05755 [Bacteroidales bacterium OttesenSCG-928-B11]|nr:hypothetical protein [Bacteroidales bacterium OttesenSCG-928-E04]MDL2312362.1 hypothetical protein [Bacteroidales bacterium OttesenSCG-928-B11]MDL2326593.1 hypothetical protein [Bacteroidales bacterium OttesenSCG-928-A14]